MRFLCSIFHPCTRIAKLDKRYHSHVCTTSSQFYREVGNKLVRGRRRNENQTCDSNNCNSRRSGVTGLCPATIGYLSSTWCFGSSYWSPHRRQRAMRIRTFDGWGRFNSLFSSVLLLLSALCTQRELAAVLYELASRSCPNASAAKSNSASPDAKENCNC
jgi:hypothetical protein